VTRLLLGTVSQWPENSRQISRAASAFLLFILIPVRASVHYAKMLGLVEACFSDVLELCSVLSTARVCAQRRTGPLAYQYDSLLPFSQARSVGLYENRTFRIVTVGGEFF